jgi:beta-glucanase (GH16 family)
MLRLLLVALLASSAILLTITRPVMAQTYELVWSDEFDGASLDLNKWEPQIGNGCPSLCGWGNNEEQYYRAENATVTGGLLTITAKEENFGGMDYTSARLRTKNLGDWKHGRFEMRAKMPIGQGLWPALWMLPTNDVYGGWAASGEIDILEYLGHQPARAFGTLHYGGSFPANTFTSNAYNLPSGDFNASFHTFVLEWDECGMRWSIDGFQYQVQKSWWTDGFSYPAPFDQLFHFLLNLAVGGNLPGSPDQTTVFPQELVVDYVRVYQRQGPDLSTCYQLFDGMEHGNPFGAGWFWFNGGQGGGGINANFVDVPPAEGCDVSLESGFASGGATGFFGGFGRRNLLNLDGYTHFTMWINPDAGQEYDLEINLQDDDNGDDIIPGGPDGNDDEFQYIFSVGPPGSDAVAGAGWQRVSIPIASFTDDNSFHFGGNGVWDPKPTSAGGNGQLVNIVMVIISSTGTDSNFRTDQWAFTRETSSMVGRVWDDSDSNGAQDGGEAGLNGVTVELVDINLNQVVGTTATVVDGNYVFSDLLGGIYTVRVDPVSLAAGSIPTYDPDGIVTANEFEAALGCAEFQGNGDFGYNSTPSNVPFAIEGRAGLRQNVPNPFNPSTVIAFEMERAGFVEVSVFDVAGRIVRHLLRANRDAGLHEVTWDGRDDRGNRVASGLYHYSMKADARRWVKRMVLLK